ncbi:cytochrome P450 [Streptomyces sp. NRRL S-350]|uniref:cytochrome P450 n=1 Tax=Streptomyces sp. NRRL S-350 TaxID=1463902 RepID=UPI001F409538|nr:cytochrome P450 [Streptomyces sp. NRRL S-350]
MSEPTVASGFGTMTFSRYDDVTAALADPALVPLPAAPVPPVPPVAVGSVLGGVSGGAPAGTPGVAAGVAWLRASVARFSSGEPHARRRALVLADLERLDPSALRVAAAAGFDPDVRRRVVRVLAEALGLADPEAVARDVATVARAYFADSPDDPEADAAVARLLPAMGDPDEETAANRIGLLVQACDATAALVEAARRNEGGLAAALREDPPVRVMRRLAARSTEVGGTAVPAGTHLVLDLAAAQAEAPDGVALTFGAAPRVCPGRSHALVIAEGILLGASDPADLASGDAVPADASAADAVPADVAPADVASVAAETPAAQGGSKAELVSLVPEMVDHVLDLAATWPAWDGRPIVNAEGRTYTPHKAVRRVVDHLIDHLAELEARLAGEPTEPDHWHASNATTPADLAPFTVADLDEARSRLTRLAGIWARRVAALPDACLDDSPGTGWSFRQVVRHVSESGYYADSVGDLSSVEAAVVGEEAV